MTLWDSALREREKETERERQQWEEMVEMEKAEKESARVTFESFRIALVAQAEHCHLLLVLAFLSRWHGLYSVMLSGCACTYYESCTHAQMNSQTQKASEFARQTRQQREKQLLLFSWSSLTKSV